MGRVTALWTRKDRGDQRLAISITNKSADSVNFKERILYFQERKGLKQLI